MRPVRLNIRAWRCRADIWNKLVWEKVEDEARRCAVINGRREMRAFSGLTSLNTSYTQAPGKDEIIHPLPHVKFHPIDYLSRLVKAASTPAMP